MSIIRHSYNSLFSLFLILAALIFSACENSSDFSQDLKDDYSAKFTFYSENPESSENFFSVNYSFPIGKTVYAQKDFPGNSTKDFVARKPGYKMNGWVFYKNPLSFHKNAEEAAEPQDLQDSEDSQNSQENSESENREKSMDSYIEFNSDGTVNKVLVVSFPASFYVNKWEPVSYSVTFFGNGGQDSEGNSQQTQSDFIYDEFTSLNANPFSNGAYYFNGWGLSENQDPSFPTYTDGASVKNLAVNEGENIKLYALWIQEKITVSFDAGEGSGSLESISVSVGDSLPDYEQTLAALTAPKGRKFSHWEAKILDSNGNLLGTRQYHPGMKFDSYNYPGRDVTLVAQWQPKGSIEGSLPANIEIEYSDEGITFRAITAGTYSSIQWLVDGTTAQNSLETTFSISYSDPAYSDGKRHTVVVIGNPADIDTDVFTAGFKFRVQN